MPDLTPKQDRFCREYVIDLNGKQAAIRTGYSKKTAEMQASRLLSKAKVRARVDYFKLRVEGKLDIKKETVLRELVRISTSDMLLLFNDDGTAKELKDIPEHARRCIAGVEIEELFTGQGKHRKSIGFTKKFKFWDKPKGLEMLGKHLKLYTDKLEVGADESFLDLLLKARERSDAKQRAKPAASTGS